MQKVRISWILASSSLAACSPNGERPGDAPAPRPPIEQPPLPPAPRERRPVRQDTILLEGSPQPIDVRLVRSAADFPVPFSTYVPSDFVVHTRERAVRFIAAFGGRRNERAFLEVAAHAVGLSETDALDEARNRGINAAGEGGELIPEDTRSDWALGAWRLRGRDVVGSVAVGRHGDRYFHVFMRYPPEYGDGFGPRAAVILEHWRWGDGSPLGPAARR